MSNILDTIDSVQDFKKIELKQYSQLAEEIRLLLIKTTSSNGGHLAPNLGVVELTMALHKAFNCPSDKIVWDVGHQAYIHKILTGRREQFGTLRQYGGLSGFPKREESASDAFNTGHSGTSISAALGIALARDINKENFHSLAVIGDGSFTNGMVYEALNQAGHSDTNLIVVLNDNAMSISPNVGALAEYFARIRTTPRYSKLKHDVEQLVRRIPTIGESVAHYAERVKDALKFIVMPGMFFEEMGFTYFGPIDGHNIQQMLDVFQNVKTVGGPILVHVVTQKGRGYFPAETKADKFHGVGPFKVSTGEAIKDPEAPESYTNVFADILVDVADERDDVVAITAAMRDGTGLSKFARKYPERFFDVGIAEAHAVTLGAGIAAGGLRPVISIYSSFLQRAYDNVVHDVCLQKLPVIFVLDRAGIVGDDGPTHHGVFDLSYLRHIPNLVVMSPKDEQELRSMFKSAFSYNCPVAIRYPRGSGVGVDCEQPLENIELGASERLRSGGDVALIPIGAMCNPAFLAAEKLADCNKIEATVLNARFVKPLDEQALHALCEKFEHIVTLEDNVLQGGFGSAVLEFINEHHYATKVLRLGWPDCFIEQGPRELMLEKYGLAVDGIVESVSKFIK
ncbi:MAG: 1-deoxy-D-xylulose-5-phosphate synthase [Negativicutes bacterium]|jgi:1-deoxy-D-xylulose-5-phosphate synthase